MTVREQATYCRICEPQCALKARVKVTDSGEEQIIKLLPDTDHPVHKGFACHKGLNFHELHHDPDRNNHPLRRANDKSAAGEFARIDWPTANHEIASKIQALQAQHGETALGFYVGNPSAFNASGRDAARRFARAVGTKYSFGSGTQDCSNKFAASEVIFGTANLHPIPDFKHTNYFLSIGSNPKISHVSFVHMTNPMQALRDIVSRGGTIKHVNPRKIESATPGTGDVLQIKPDTDVYLLAAILHTVFDEGLEDSAALAAHATNIEALRAYCADYSPQQVAPVVGVSAAEIATIARDFSAADGASVHMSTGANMGRQGTLAYWLVQMLSLATGNLGRRGGNIYSPGYFPAATVGKPKTEDPFYESEFGEMRRIVGSLPGNLLADHIEAGLVKGLICMSGNPLLSMAGEQRLMAALAQLELLVVVDIYPNATSMLADYVLPATDWLERADINSVSLGFQPEPYIQYTAPVVQPKFERRQEWQIFAGLLQALGEPSMLDQPDPDPFARIDRQFANVSLTLNDKPESLTLDTLKSLPGSTLRLPDPVPEDLFDIGVQHPGARVDCYPALIQRGVARSREIFAELKNEPAEGLKLISLRTNYMVNSWMHNLKALKRDIALTNPLHIHPADLDNLGLEAGQEVRVASDFGEIIAQLKVDEDLRPGVVAMTHGWGHGNNPALSVASNHPGINVNALLPTGKGSFDPLSNMSFMTGIPVAVKAA